MRHKSLCSANEQARMRPVNHPAPPQPFADIHFGRRPVSYPARPKSISVNTQARMRPVSYPGRPKSISVNTQARMRPVNHPGRPQPFADIHFGRRPVSYPERPKSWSLSNYSALARAGGLRLA